jgi:hypothetical protein
MGKRNILALGIFFALVVSLFPANSALAQDFIRVPGDVNVDQCPIGWQVAIGIEVNVTTGERFTLCYGPLTDADILQRQQEADFQAAVQAAMAAAEAESVAWNAANPGQQKCVQWGPIVHANGVSTASGGVCANPVPAAAPTTTPTIDSRPADTVSPPTSDATTQSPPSTTTPTNSVEARPVDNAPSLDIRPVDVLLSQSTRESSTAPGSTVVPQVTTDVPPAISVPVIDHPLGVGGWAEVDGNNNVLNLDVCEWAVCGDPNSSFALAFQARGTHFVYWAPAYPDGNVAGWGSGSSYDPSTNLFTLGSCHHYGGAQPQDIFCDSVTTSDANQGQTLMPVLSNDARSDSTSASANKEPVPQEPVGQANPPALAVYPLPTAPSVESVSTSVVIEPSTDLRAGADNSSESSSNAGVAIAEPIVGPASLARALQDVPKVAAQATVRLPIFVSKVRIRSLSPKICSVSASRIKQLSTGNCKVEFSLSLPGGIRLSSLKIVKFSKNH